MSWSEYDRWNDALVDVMFPELELPEPVYMDFEQEQIDALALVVGVPSVAVEEALARVVRETLSGNTPATIFAPHMHRLANWVKGGREGPPPFVALLAVFCLAAEQMQAGDGMASSNYFGRLQAVFNWTSDKGALESAYRRVAERTWGELNRWLVELDGRRGLPTAFALSHRFVGLTVSQALVRSGDRDRFRQFFREYGFAPGSDVAPTQLVHVLGAWMGQTPSPVSKSLQRLWQMTAARERIAQAAAVALASWDGSVVEKLRDGTTSSSRGHLALTLELGGFPQKRFALQALFYLPDGRIAREATVLTASPEVTVELVPDLAGALSLGRGSAMHPQDVLEGDLQIRDSRSGQVLRRRPRRLVLFREDDLSKRWIESPQVMLGDSVRLLVHADLDNRLHTVLDKIARPGWRIADPYPNQPEGWLVVLDVEVLAHPGDLVKAGAIDDLSPLVPLTTSQLKVADGFALPGRIRGKWHSWAPPEVRAVSDHDGGFVVRLIETGLTEESAGDGSFDDVVLAEWDDEGTGVVMQPLAELELGDGDYRLELVAAGDKDPSSAVNLHLRSSDTPDLRQWALLEGIAYGAGVGVLGLPVDLAGARVNGLVVTDAPEVLAWNVGDVPAAPWWSTDRDSRAIAAPVVRLTMPDKDSCMYTGRHVEMVDTVPTDSMGKPLVAWSFGRCKSCGLERRYPTRLPRHGYGSRRVAETAPPPVKRDLSEIRPVNENPQEWATAFDSLLHTGGGSWAQLERIAFQLEPSTLFLDQFARNLEVLGHLDVRRDPLTLEPVSWEVGPTLLAETTEGFLYSGFWPNNLYVSTAAELEAEGTLAGVHSTDGAPDSYFAMIGDAGTAAVEKAAAERDVPVVWEAWRDLAAHLPPLSAIADLLPRRSDLPVGSLTMFQPQTNSWVSIKSFEQPGAYRVRRFSVVDIFRSPLDVENGTYARSTVQLGKHLVGQMMGRPLMAYEPATEDLRVPLGADLPALYGRAIVAASGCAPHSARSEGAVRYQHVPAELASRLYDLLKG